MLAGLTHYDIFESAQLAQLVNDFLVWGRRPLRAIGAVASSKLGTHASKGSLRRQILS